MSIQQTSPTDPTSSTNDPNQLSRYSDSQANQPIQPPSPNPQSPTHLQYYSIGQAADYLHVSIDTVRRWEKKGLLRAIRTAGNLRRFTKAELDSFKRESENQDVTMSISEAAKELGVSIQTLRRWDKSGKLKPRRNTEDQRVYPKKLIRQILENGLAAFSQSDSQTGVGLADTAPPTASDRVKYTPTGVVDADKPAYDLTAAQNQVSHAGSTATDSHTDDSSHTLSDDDIMADSSDAKAAPADAKHSQPTSQPQDQPISTQDPAVEALAEPQAPLKPKPSQTQSPLSEIGLTLKTFQAVIEPAQYNEAGDLIRPQIEDHGADSAGTATLPQNCAKMVVKTGAVTDNSLVLVTPISLVATPLCVPVAIAEEGFAVAIAVPQAKDIRFNWCIIQAHFD